MRIAESGPEDLQARTKRFALRIIRLYRSLRKSGEADVIGRQVLRSGTSVGAQYREACRARSPAEFISKIESATQELSETEYWLELLVEAEVVSSALMQNLLNESRELTAIFVASANTAKRSAQR